MSKRNFKTIRYTTDSEGKRYYLKSLSINQLCVVSELQRGNLGHTLINNISKDFKQKSCGSFTVAELSDGRFHICDGQHRWLGIKAAIDKYNREDLVNIKIPCMIYVDLTDIEIRDICLSCNKARATMSNYDQFEFGVRDNNIRNVFLKNIIEEHNFSTNKKDHSLDFVVNPISLNDALRHISDDDEILNLTDLRYIPYIHMTLDLIGSLWMNNKFRTDSKIVTGLFWFLKSYFSEIINQGITKKELIFIFERTSPSAIISIMKEIATYRLISDSPNGSRVSNVKCRKIAFLSAFYMSKNYDFDNTFFPSSKVKSNDRFSDIKCISNVKERLSASDYLIPNKKRLVKFERDSKKAFGLKYFPKDYVFTEQYKKNEDEE